MQQLTAQWEQKVSAALAGIDAGGAETSAFPIIILRKIT
jgi:hypothetical protein